MENGIQQTINKLKEKKNKIWKANIQFKTKTNFLILFLTTTVGSERLYFK